MARDLMVNSPESVIQVVESWGNLDKGERKRRAAKAAINRDRPVLRGLLWAYVGHFGRKHANTSPGTLRTYWQGAALLIDWTEGVGIQLHQIEPEHGGRWIASMHKLAAKTQATYLIGGRNLVRALGWAGMGDGSALDQLSVTDPNADTIKADQYESAELARLLAAADRRERALVLLAADCGLRLHESAKLKASAVDYQRAQLRIKGKGGKVATIAATARTLDALRALDVQRGPLFGITPRRVGQIVTRLCKRAEVNARGYHNLRHTCGTRLYRMTQDILLVQRHLRHSSVTTTQIYAHLADEEYTAAIAEFGEYRNGKGQDTESDHATSDDPKAAAAVTS